MEEGKEIESKDMTETHTICKVFTGIPAVHIKVPNNRPSRQGSPVSRSPRTLCIRKIADETLKFLEYSLMPQARHPSGRRLNTS